MGNPPPGPPGTPLRPIEFFVAPESISDPLLDPKRAPVGQILEPPRVQIGGFLVHVDGIYASSLSQLSVDTYTHLLQYIYIYIYIYYIILYIYIYTYI